MFSILHWCSLPHCHGLLSAAGSPSQRAEPIMGHRPQRDLQVLLRTLRPWVQVCRRGDGLVCRLISHSFSSPVCTEPSNHLSHSNDQEALGCFSSLEYLAICLVSASLCKLKVSKNEANVAQQSPVDSLSPIKSLRISRAPAPTPRAVQRKWCFTALNQDILCFGLLPYGPVQPSLR